VKRLAALLAAGAFLAGAAGPALAGGTRVLIRITRHEVKPLALPRTLHVPSRRWAAGHWRTYGWVPQVCTHDVWVPPSLDPGGRWVPGHYRVVAVPGGYFRPVWVPRH
jgi:hypothetical protein